MSSPLILGLRNVDFDVPDLAAAELFYTSTWRLAVASRDAQSIFLRGTGTDHHLLTLRQSPTGTAQIRSVTLRAVNRDALDVIVQNVRRVGAHVLHDQIAVPEGEGGGWVIAVADLDGRVFRVVADDNRVEPRTDAPDSPVRLAHAVLNSRSIPSTQPFFEQVFGFALIDRTRIMAFLNCADDHHTIALGDADNDALNHVAFLMNDLDAVMRGGGRMLDAGHPIEWGPGRHGPGNNAFNYFLDPFGFVIEYTADVQQVDDSYPVGSPDDWKWPAGRVDQWGISLPSSDRLKSAQRAVPFAPFVAAPIVDG